MSALTGKTVLISGAARGIGAATARALSEEGARLVLFDVDAQPLEALVAEIGEDRAVGTVADARDLGAVQAAVDAGIDRFGGIDFVVANAGITSYGSTLRVDPEAFREVIEIDIVGVFHTVRAALPSVIAHRGYILVVSSLAAYLAAPGLAAYSTAKAGVEHFANTLRLEMRPYGVDVGTAHMSWIDTPMVQEARTDLPAFDRAFTEMPGPLGRVRPVETCATAFVRGLDKRSRRVYVPGWVGAAGWARALLNSAVGDRFILRFMSDMASRMDDHIAALGRSTSARVFELVTRS